MRIPVAAECATCPFILGKAREKISQEILSFLPIDGITNIVDEFTRKKQILEDLKIFACIRPILKSITLEADEIPMIVANKNTILSKDANSIFHFDHVTIFPRMTKLFVKRLASS